MRPPWDHNAQASSDLEALQTDVMRFVAILGLCLAAIFSLVNGAQTEQREATALPAASLTQAETSGVEPVPAPGPTAQAVSAIEQPAVEESLDVPEPSAEAELIQAQTGFTLEFESGDALRKLLDAGGFRLYIKAGGRFNQYRPGGGFVEADPPGSYYRMEPATVPRQIRLQAEGLFGGAMEWGITIPGATASELERLMRDREGGSLLIDDAARVSLVDAGP